MGRIFNQNLHEFPGGFRGGVEPLDEAGSRFMSRVQLEPATAVLTGQVTLGKVDTPTPLAPESTPVRRVVLKKLGTNTGNVYVGGPGVTGLTGFPLDQELTLFVADLNSLYITGGTAGDGVAFIAEVPLGDFE